MNKKKFVVIGVIVGIIVIMFIIRTINLSKKGKETPSTEVATTEQVNTQVTEATTEEPEDSYKQSLGIGNEDEDGRVEVDRDELTTEVTTEYVQTEPTYSVSVNIFDHTEVPTKMMDGTSCINYYKNVSLNQFGTFWGTSLTEEDFIGHKKYLVGVAQDPNDTEKGDLQSVGWLMDNLEAGKFQANDAIKFTNLHIIGSLSDTHVALLCCYDWYSAWGITDTLVVFEDISNTLKVEDFTDGSIFSATVFVHNIKLMDNVNGKRVVVVQYTPFE